MVGDSVSQREDTRVRSPRIALLVSQLNDEYEWKIVRGVKAAVEARGGSVSCWAGGTLGDPRQAVQPRGFVYDLVDAARADGVISVSSVVGQYMGSDSMSAWLKQRGLPVCSVGEVDDVPSVLIDQGDGTTQLMEHLALHHGYRRIAFVTGSRGNPEAEARLTAYRHALEAHGLRIDERLILEGNFTRESGIRAVLSLLDTRQVKLAELDAIVASNDYTAFGVIDELMRRKIAVPDEVAVVGFDDMALARKFRPSLTTIRQPLELLGREAAHVLLDLLAGRSVEPRVALRTDMFLRRSCGCSPTEPPPAGMDGESLPPVSNEGRALLDAVLAEHHGARGGFARALETFLRQANSAQDAALGEDLIAVGRPKSSPQAERSRERADLMAGDLAEQALRVQPELEAKLHRLARALELRMFGPQAMLSTTLVEHLPELGVFECAVSEWSPVRPHELTLAFGLSPRDLQPKLVTFPARELVPPGFEGLREGSSLVLPLHYGSESLGIAVLPATGRDGVFFETLAEVFGIVLKGIQMRRAVRSK